jgi:hypothetical protein
MMALEEIEKRWNWSDWRVFPNPTMGEYLYAPLGPGVYQLRIRSTGAFLLFGAGENLAYRMSSLLPEPYGCGTRKNHEKRQTVWNNTGDVEYRTVACSSKSETMEIETALRLLNIHRYNT